MSGEAATPKLSLYYYDSCPFCVRVLHAARTLGVELDLRDIMSNPEHRRALLDARGRGTVPVLRIQDGANDEWMPESRDIVHYLKRNFG